LPVGPHKVIVTAIDPSGNEGRAEVDFTRIDPSKLPPKGVKFVCVLKPKKGEKCKSGLLIGGKGKTRTLRGEATLTDSCAPTRLNGWKKKCRGDLAALRAARSFSGGALTCA